MCNLEIRNALRSYRVFGYEIAEALGWSESYFSGKLSRQEFSDEKKAEVLSLIRQLASNREMMNDEQT